MAGFLNSSSQPFSINPSASTATTSSAGGFSFGQSAGTGFNFGTSQPSATATVSPFTGLGSAAPGPTSTPASNPSGFTFGQTSSTSAPALNFGLGSANTAPTTPSTGLFVQTQATPSAPTFSAGAPTISTGVPALSAGLFGQTQTSNPSSTSGFLFTTSQTNPSTPASSSGFFALSSSSTTPASTGGISFGLPTPAASSGGIFAQTSTQPTQSSGLNFSFPSSTSASSGGGLFNLASTSTPSASTGSQNIGLGGTSQPISVGLGGLATSTTDSAGFGNNAMKGDGSSAKEAPLPQDIFAAVALFESYKDDEKKRSEDNIRQTAAPFHKLVEDSKKLRQHIQKISNQHSQLQSSARKLKSSVIQESENVEMARRTHDTPTNLQGTNNAPEQFFLRLIKSFEERLTFCRDKIDEVDKCTRNANLASDVNPDELKEILKKEHNMIKVLAAKIYALRNQLYQHATLSETHPPVLEHPLKSHQGPDPVLIGINNRTVTRPSLGEKGSGLIDFQTGQQKAKALALGGASPPTLSLSQSSMPNLLGSGNTSSSLFSNNTNFGSSPLNFGGGSSAPTFGLGGAKSGFGTPSGLFGVPSQGSSPPSFGFSSTNSSLFANSKSFRKSSFEAEELQRKRKT